MQELVKKLRSYQKSWQQLIDAIPLEQKTYLQGKESFQGILRFVALLNSLIALMERSSVDVTTTDSSTLQIECLASDGTLFRSTEQLLGSDYQAAYAIADQIREIVKKLKYVQLWKSNLKNIISLGNFPEETFHKYYWKALNIGIILNKTFPKNTEMCPLIYMSYTDLLAANEPILHLPDRFFSFNMLVAAIKSTAIVPRNILEVGNIWHELIKLHGVESLNRIGLIDDTSLYCFQDTSRGVGCMFGSEDIHLIVQQAIRTNTSFAPPRLTIERARMLTELAARIEHELLSDEEDIQSEPQQVFAATIRSLVLLITLAGLEEVTPANRNYILNVFYAGILDEEIVQELITNAHAQRGACINALRDVDLPALPRVHNQQLLVIELAHSATPEEFQAVISEDYNTLPKKRRFPVMLAFHDPDEMRRGLSVDRVRTTLDLIDEQHWFAYLQILGEKALTRTKELRVGLLACLRMQQFQPQQRLQLLMEFNRGPVVDIEDLEKILDLLDEQDWSTYLQMLGQKYLMQILEPNIRVDPREEKYSKLCRLLCKRTPIQILLLLKGLGSKILKKIYGDRWLWLEELLVRLQPEQQLNLLMLFSFSRFCFSSHLLLQESLENRQKIIQQLGGIKFLVEFFLFSAQANFFEMPRLGDLLAIFPVNKWQTVLQEFGKDNLDKLFTHGYPVLINLFHNVPRENWLFLLQILESILGVDYFTNTLPQKMSPYSAFKLMYYSSPKIINRHEAEDMFKEIDFVSIFLRTILEKFGVEPLLTYLENNKDNQHFLCDVYEIVPILNALPTDQWLLPLTIVNMRKLVTIPENILNLFVLIPVQNWQFLLPALKQQLGTDYMCELLIRLPLFEKNTFFTHGIAAENQSQLLHLFWSELDLATFHSFIINQLTLLKNDAQNQEVLLQNLKKLMGETFYQILFADKLLHVISAKNQTQILQLFRAKLDLNTFRLFAINQLTLPATTLDKILFLQNLKNLFGDVIYKVLFADKTYMENLFFPRSFSMKNSPGKFTSPISFGNVPELFKIFEESLGGEWLSKLIPNTKELIEILRLFSADERLIFLQKISEDGYLNNVTITSEQITELETLIPSLDPFSFFPPSSFHRRYFVEHPGEPNFKSVTLAEHSRITDEDIQQLLGEAHEIGPMTLAAHQTRLSDSSSKQVPGSILAPAPAMLSESPTQTLFTPAVTSLFAAGVKEEDLKDKKLDLSS